MTKDELKIKIEKCFENAVNQLREQGDLPPLLEIAFTEDNGKEAKIGMFIAGAEKDDRDKFIHAMGILIGIIQSIGRIKEMGYISFVSEAWFSVAEKEKYESGKFVMPSKDPKRREMLLCVGMLPDGTQEVIMKEMFSSDIKGKRYFTLSEFKDGKAEGAGKHESYLLENFYNGYKVPLVDTSMAKKLFKDSNMKLPEMLEIGTKHLIELLGNGKFESEIISFKK